MKHVSVDEIKQMTDTEGLILQGCGGNLSEWENGINELLTEKGILRDGDTFKDICVFHHGGLTNMLFSMEDVNLDVGRLAMWRLQTHSNFGGTWLSDYLPNALGVDIDAQRPPEKSTELDPLELVAVNAVEIGRSQSTSGNYIVSFDEAGEGILPTDEITQNLDKVLDYMYQHDAVADEIEIVDGSAFDICFNLAYCPSYIPNNEEIEEYGEGWPEQEEPSTNPLILAKLKEIKELKNHEKKPSVLGQIEAARKKTDEPAKPKKDKPSKSEPEL